MFLNDWTIKIDLLDEIEMPEQNCFGFNHYYSTNKACNISIKKMHNTDKDLLEKPCHELVIIHELLHCKPLLTHWAKNEHSASACYLEQAEHTMLEQMAKSLLMAKYNINFEWFKNFE